MNSFENCKYNPLNRIDVSFVNYVNRRKKSSDNHMSEGVPDYAYAMDNELRQQMMKIPAFDKLCRYVSGTIETRMMHIKNQDSLAVGPNQFPEVYQMGVDCARILGIGIPNIYIEMDSSVNAYTYATDDNSPLLVITSGLLERMTPGELKAVIGHECGHIHNRHSVYTNVVNYVLSFAGNSIGGFLLTTASAAAMYAWSRAAEVTADRAALICSDNFEDAESVDKKFLYGAAFGEHEVNVEPLRKQLDMMMTSPTQIYELLDSHPGAIRRIIANMEFIECETLYNWRPEKKKPGQIMRSKEETDIRCKKFIGVFKKK